MPRAMRKVLNSSIGSRPSASPRVTVQRYWLECGHVLETKTAKVSGLQHGLIRCRACEAKGAE